METCTLMTVSSWILLRDRNIADKVVDKTKTHILFSVIFFFENRSVWKIC